MMTPYNEMKALVQDTTHKRKERTLHTEMFMENISTFFTNEYTSLTCLHDYSPTVTVEYQHSAYYSVYNGVELCYFLNYKEAQSVLLYMVRSWVDRPDIREEITQYDIQHHHNYIPIYTLTELGTVQRKDHVTKMIDANQLLEQLQLAYRALHDIETNLANLMGFHNLQEALKYPYVQDFVANYTPFEVLTLEDTETFQYLIDAWHELGFDLLMSQAPQDEVIPTADAQRQFAFTMQPRIREKELETFRAVFFAMYQNLMLSTGGDLTYNIGWVRSIVEGMSEIYSLVDVEVELAKTYIVNF